MTEVIKTIKEKAEKIADLMLSNMINDVDLLAVALSVSNFTQVVQTLSISSVGEYKHTAAHKALDIAWNPAFRNMLAKEGYFAKGLRGLMKLAKQDHDLASRLSPVFGAMVDCHKELGISKKLKSETECYMKWVFKRDGFSITGMSDDSKVDVKLDEALLVSILSDSKE